jgi:sec-independent protein translocase protein TatB
MFGINIAELSIIIVIALVVIGPERLPQYASSLGRAVRDGRRMALGMREQVREELGPDFDDVDWRKLDPRQYDPRRIVREALSEAWEDDEPAAQRWAARETPTRRPKPASSGATPASQVADGAPPPYDVDAT